VRCTPTPYAGGGIASPTAPLGRGPAPAAALILALVDRGPSGRHPTVSIVLSISPDARFS